MPQIYYFRDSNVSIDRIIVNGGLKLSNYDGIKLSIYLKSFPSA